MESFKDLITETFAIFMEGWWWMLGAGILHGTYHAIPAVGYWTAVLASVFFSNAGTRLNMMRRIKHLNGEK